jgi:hypothetical protein
MNAYQTWLDLKTQQREIEEKLLQAEVEMYSAHIDELNAKEKGTINISVPGYRLKVVKRENVKVDQKVAAAIGMGFRTKYELDAKAYDALSDEQKHLVNSALTVTPGKPTFTVEVA